MSLITSYIERIRLVVGDTDVEYEYLVDSVYDFLYYDNGQDELKTAIAALENIINYLALNPESETLGQVMGKRMSMKSLEDRLLNLKAKQTADSDGNIRLPMMIRSNRTDWSDINKLFRKQ